MLANLGFSLHDVVGGTVSGGKDYYLVHLNIGPTEPWTGIVSFTSAPDFNATEVGFKIKTGTALWLAGAYRSTNAGKTQFDMAANPAMFGAAEDANLFIDGFHSDKFMGDLFWRPDSRTLINGTFQISNVTGENSPISWYAGVKLQYRLGR
jgi:hypothetical protein